MSDHGKPDKPGLWRDANEKTVVACMESGELRMRDPDTGMVLSGEWVERAAPFRQAEWKGTKLIGAGFSAMPDTAGCWCDANGTLWLITGGDVIDGHIFRLKEPGREWECAPCFGITVRMLHEWGPWTRCDFNPKDDEAVRFDWCKPWIADHGWDDDMSEPHRLCWLVSRRFGRVCRRRTACGGSSMPGPASSSGTAAGSACSCSIRAEVSWTGVWVHAHGSDSAFRSVPHRSRTCRACGWTRTGTCWRCPGNVG